MKIKMIDFFHSTIKRIKISNLAELIGKAYALTICAKSFLFGFSSSDIYPHNNSYTDAEFIA